MVYTSLIPTPPTCCCFTFPSHQCSISLLPAFPLTHRTAPGWPPDTQQSRAGPRLLLAGAARPLHRHRVHPAACTSRGPGGGWCLQGWHCMGTMARFSALFKSRGWVDACAPTLSLVPRARGYWGQLGHSQHRNIQGILLLPWHPIAGRETGSPFPPTSVPPGKRNRPWKGFQSAPSFLPDTVGQKSRYVCAVISISGNVRPFTL